MPVAFEFAETNLKFLAEKVFRVESVIAQDFIYPEELRLLVDDDACIRRYGNLAIRECVESVNRFVRRDVVREMNQYLRLLGGEVLNLANLYLTLVLRLENRVDQEVGRLSVGDFCDGDGVLVDFLDFGTHLYHSAAPSVVVTRTVRVAAGREVRENLERLVLQYGYRSVNQLVEIVRENLRGKACGDAFGALREQ